MEQTLFQDLGPEERLQMLQSNAEQIEEIGYHKPFSVEELDTQKDELAKVSVSISNLEQDKKDYMTDHKSRMKPLQEDKNQIVRNIKSGGEYVEEKCYKLVDRDEGMTGYYNAEGALAFQRRANAQEMMERNVFALSPMTGTND